MGRRSKGKGGSKDSRVSFRHNRQKPARRKQWDVPDEHNESAEDVVSHESVRAKGDLSRKRTVTDIDLEATSDAGRLAEGRVVAVRGQFVDVDGEGRVWPCSVRRVLRTRKIDERSPVAVGDQVTFSIIADDEGVLNEGVIEKVHPRKTELKRSDGRKTHTIAVNVDQVIIVGSTAEPYLKPHLFDRYLVAAHAGGLESVICVNKIDLEDGDEVDVLLERYRRLGYPAFKVSAARQQGIDQVRAVMKDRISLVAGQSGVGKSSLLNALQPGLNLATGEISSWNEKGRHTTTTARWLPLEFGGAVIDTPGIRALDIAMVPLAELEMHFIEFVEHVQHCKFPDCVHIHETGCAVMAAVESGDIDPARYDSYVTMFTERGEG